MKEICKKISGVLRVIFGYGIMISLLVGGLTFFGYIAALIIGGDTAAVICEVIYKTIIPIVIKVATICVLLGLVVMYLNGEMALTSNKHHSSKHEGEM